MAAGDGGRVLTFRLSRIERISLLDETDFIPPPDDYNPEIFRQSSWYVKGGQLRRTIRLEIREPIASTVSDIRRHPTQKIQPQSRDNHPLRQLPGAGHFRRSESMFERHKMYYPRDYFTF